MCKDCMLALLGNPTDRLAPSQSMLMKLANFPVVEAHLSPKTSHFHDVNVIGMDLLNQLTTSIRGTELTLELFT